MPDYKINTPTIANDVTVTMPDTTGTLALTSQAGVTGFTASQNTASPNNGVNASRLLVNAASSDADAVIQPKGSGALLAQLPNSSTTGGNKRGPYALDLQTLRSTSSQVASAYGSVVIGDYNTCNATEGVTIGTANTTNATNNAYAFGAYCQATNSRAVAIGSLNTASGIRSAAIGGHGNTASGEYSSIFSGYNAVANSYGQHSYAVGSFTSAGDCQVERYVVRAVTTDATITNLTVDGQRIAIANDSTYTFTALVTARRTEADNESAGYKIEGVIDNNAGTTAFVGTPTVTVLAEDTAAWDVVVEADNAIDALVIKVTGETGKTIRWGAVVELMKVSG